MKLNYKAFGSGPPIIILHGLFGMLDNWRTIAKMIGDRYQCILVDLRNHGKSPHTDEMNYTVMSEDVLELMHDLKIEITLLMGHSMGGKVAMRFALAYPDKVEKLIVVDISPKQYPPHHDHIIEAIESIDLDKLEKRSDAGISLRNHLRGDEATIQFLLKNLNRKPKGGFEWKANMRVLVTKYDTLLDDINSSTTFDKPTFFIRGEKSDSVHEEDWTLIQALFLQAQLITIPGAGHWVHSDAPKLFTAALLSFLES